MSKEVAVISMVAVGGLVGLQAPVNAQLAGSIGKLGATTMNFVVGGLLVVFITFVLADGFQTGGESVPWYVWVVGGIAGAAYVIAALSAVPALGAGGVTVATIAGQLTLSLVADRLGILGLEEKAITPSRILGVGLLALGVLLVVRD